MFCIFLFIYTCKYGRLISLLINVAEAVHDEYEDGERHKSNVHSELLSGIFGIVKDTRKAQAHA